MRIEKIILVAFLSLLLLEMASKAEVTLHLPTRELAIGVGETKSLNITLKNLQDRKDLFSLLVWPPLVPKFGIHTSIPARVELEPGGEATFPLTFIIPECTAEGDLLFEVTAISMTNASIKDSKSLTLKVRGEGLTCITKITTDKSIFSPEEEVKIEISIANYAEKGDFVLEIALKKDGRIEESFRDAISLRSRETKTLSYAHTLRKYAEAGKYLVDALLKRNERVISSRTFDFEVRAIENVTHSHSTKNFLILQTGSIRIRNLGNAPSSPATQSLIVPWFMAPFFYSPTAPVSESKVNGQVRYIWAIPALGSLAEYEIGYEFRFWPIWVGIAAVIASILFAYSQLYSIRVVKRTRPIGVLAVGKEIPISISIVNNSRSELRDILARDLVPPIVSLIERFETLRPVKRRTRAGMELNWRIGSLKPGEEVILSYRVAPIVDIIGTLKLSPATIKFTVEGKRKTTASKPIIIAG